MPRYDLSHQSFMLGKLGSLQALSCVPIVAGDKISMQGQVSLRLGALRRHILRDVKVDLFAFYVPHRHVYGDDWITFIKDGQDEAITFTGVTATGGNYRHYGNAGYPQNDSIPKWIVAGYNQIWNRYFRIPSDDASLLADTDLVSTNHERAYGKLCARLPSIWTTGIDSDIVDADKEVAISGSVLDIIDLAKQKGHYRTQLQRDWFGQYYNDILKEAFNSQVNVDADQRPTLLMRSTSWLSGYDVDGTGDANLGDYSGKSVGVTPFGFPRRFFPEHGALWIMALLRFPIVAQREMHRLHMTVNPDYKMFSGDPALWEHEPPEQLQCDDYFTDGGAVDLGYTPYGQMYRMHPSAVHGSYVGLTGYPFMQTTPTTTAQARYEQANEYDTVFKSTSEGHFQVAAHLGLLAERVVPGPKSSIFAGV